MSTKCSVSYGDNHHLYNECFDDENIYLSLKNCPFEVSNGGIMVSIPLYIWETIRHKGAPDLSKADLTDDQLLQIVETEVDRRIKEYQGAVDNDKLGSWLNFCGSFIFGGASTPREEQVKLGMEYSISERARQKAIKDKVEGLRKKDENTEQTAS